MYFSIDNFSYNLPYILLNNSTSVKDVNIVWSPNNPHIWNGIWILAKKSAVGVADKEKKENIKLLHRVFWGESTIFIILKHTKILPSLQPTKVHNTYLAIFHSSYMLQCFLSHSHLLHSTWYTKVWECHQYIWKYYITMLGGIYCETVCL